MIFKKIVWLDDQKEISNYCSKYRLDRENLTKENIYSILKINGLSNFYIDINYIALLTSGGTIPLPLESILLWKNFILLYKTKRKLNYIDTRTIYTVRSQHITIAIFVTSNCFATVSHYTNIFQCYYRISTLLDLRNFSPYFPFIYSKDL